MISRCHGSWIKVVGQLTSNDFFPKRLNDFLLTCASATCSAVCCFCGRGLAASTVAGAACVDTLCPNSPSSDESVSSIED